MARGSRSRGRRHSPEWFAPMLADAARTHRCTPEEVLSKSREGRIVRARHAVIWACWKAGLSYPHIGHLMGRDHSTAVYSRAQVEKDRNLLAIAQLLHLEHVQRRRVA